MEKQLLEYEKKHRDHCEEHFECLENKLSRKNVSQTIVHTQKAPDHTKRY